MLVFGDHHGLGARRRRGCVEEGLRRGKKLYILFAFFCFVFVVVVFDAHGKLVPS